MAIIKKIERFHVAALFVVLMAIVLTYCSQPVIPEPPPTVPPTSMPTETPRPTETYTPTSTATNTQTPSPTNTPVPTETPTRVFTPTNTQTPMPPTETPTATATATLVPIPACGVGCLSGYASRYAPGRMAEVLTHNIGEGKIDPVFGNLYGIAVLECSRVGQVARVRHDAGEPWIMVIVADCAGDAPTVDWMLSNHIIVELDYDLATLLGMPASPPYGERGFAIELYYP